MLPAPIARLGYSGEWSKLILTLPLRTRKAPSACSPASNKMLPLALTIGVATF